MITYYWYSSDCVCRLHGELCKRHIYILYVYILPRPFRVSIMLCVRCCLRNSQTLFSLVFNIFCFKSVKYTEIVSSAVSVIRVLIFFVGYNENALCMGSNEMTSSVARPRYLTSYILTVRLLPFVTYTTCTHTHTLVHGHIHTLFGFRFFFFIWYRIILVYFTNLCCLTSQ